MQHVLMNWINYCHLLINHLQFTETEEDSAVISSNSQNDVRQQYDLELNVALLNGFFGGHSELGKYMDSAAVLASENLLW